MERLTKKILTAIQDKYSLGGYLYYDFAKANDTNKLLNKLGQFEDFMEEQGFESLEELKINIEYLKDKIKTDKFNYEQLHKFKNHLQEENQALKQRWEKLWDWICDKKPISKGANAIFKKSEILDKMRELEFADLIRRKEK